jgi:hypothetical protein
MPVDVQSEIVIDLPRERVSEYAADPSRAPDWYANIESVEWETPPDSGRATGHAHRSGGPFPMETTCTWAPRGDSSTSMTLRTGASRRASRR